MICRERVPVEAVGGCALSSHELQQQRQGLHAHAKGSCVGGLEQGI